MCIDNTSVAVDTVRFQLDDDRRIFSLRIGFLRRRKY